MARPPKSRASERRGVRRSNVVVALVVVAVAAGAAFYFWPGDSDDSPSSTTAQTTTTTTTTTTSSPRTGPVAVSASGLATLASLTSYPIYWAGPRASKLYEIKQASNGDVTLRYLPRGARAGHSGMLLSIGTYPRPDAYDAGKKTLEAGGNVEVPVGGGALAFLSKQS